MSPIVGKSIRFPFQLSIVAWVDLLGYGSMISEAGFNPLHSKAAAAIKRLRAFHECVATHSMKRFPTLVMNDGAVAYRDLSLRSRSVTYDFIIRAWQMFSAIRDLENAAGHPGPRMIIATGFRMRGRRAGIDAVSAQLDSIFTRHGAGLISTEQAIKEASQANRYFDIIPALQANFAFSKAYVADANGKSGGLGGANCFIDLTIFKNSPSCFKLGPTINWQSTTLSLSAAFASVISVPKLKHTQGGPIDVRDGLEIAQHLAGNTDILTTLRKARKP